MCNNLESDYRDESLKACVQKCIYSQITMQNRTCQFSKFPIIIRETIVVPELESAHRGITRNQILMGSMHRLCFVRKKAVRDAKRNPFHKQDLPI